MRNQAILEKLAFIQWEIRTLNTESQAFTQMGRQDVGQ
jgi:hypothetical protein